MEALAAYGWPCCRHPGLYGILRPLFRRLPDQAPGELLYDPDYPGAPAMADGGVVRAVQRRDLPDPLPLPGGRIYQRFRERTEARRLWPDPSREAPS